MPKLTNIRRIVPEDFKQEDQETVSRIAESYNDFADEVYRYLNGLLDFDNFARSKVTVDVVFDSDGNPVGGLTINSGLPAVAMITIGRVQNLSNPAGRLIATPFLDWTSLGSGSIKILYGRGFQPGIRYRVTLELVQ